MKKVIVISDNPELTSFFKNEWQQQSLESIAQVDYFYSANNKFPSEMVLIGAKKLNVKDDIFCKEAKEKYNLIISIHSQQIFPKTLVSSVICVNFHPGLNPYNRGLYPQVFSIVNKLPTGATLHVMDEEIDHGCIIAQKKVLIKSTDTSLDVYNRIICAEKDLIRENLVALVNGNYDARKPNAEGNYNSIFDFKDLCKLNMNAKGTLREHIDLLRALTHGKYKNAYFIDENNNKVYVTINLEISE